MGIPQNISQNMELLLLASCLTLTLGVDIPTKLTSAGATTLVDLVTLAGLGDTLAGEGPFTVFAPTNDDMIATQVFKAGHVRVVSYSGGVRQSAKVIDADILASNGVIHVIDSVI